MAEKYGRPGQTDNEGFDPYRDTVGPGIYGGIVKRDPQTGAVVIGRQYQNHNPRPGPVYAGGGYTPSTMALGDPQGRLIPLLEKYPDLVNDVTTGGASPLHMCGMSRGKEGAVSTLVKYGADIEALDTYGMTPLHRMASNNLGKGAAALIEAGVDPEYKGEVGITPLQMAQQSRAYDVIKVLSDKSLKVFPRNTVSGLQLINAGATAVNGKYTTMSHKIIPEGFQKVCESQGWNTQQMWIRLNGDKQWYKHDENESYVYFNESDGMWWIDGPDGYGVYIAKAPKHAPPAHGWKLIKDDVKDREVPMMLSFRNS